MRPISELETDPGSGDSEVRVENPATGETIGSVANLGPEQVAELVVRARRSQPAWQALTFEQRGRLLRRLRAWLIAERKRVIEALMAESGKTYEDALVEVFHLCGVLGFWAKHAERYLREERRWTRSPMILGRRVVVRYEPLGVVGAIAPWNYPLVLGLGDALPALMAGNAAVLKPSGITPLSTLLVAEEGMRTVGFPADVCLVATGRGGAGTALVDNADMVQFTGSAAVGRQIAARAAERLIPVSLELGGKDPMIVLADADLERAASIAVLHAMGNSGQTCMAVERVYVEGSVYDDFVDRLRGKASALRQGRPGAPGSVDVGSLTGPGQIDIVDRHVSEAVAAGATVLCGGRRRPGGDFYEPTVLVDVDHTMACMVEETFGPILPVVKVRDAEEAIKLANDSSFGLNSSVFTGDVANGNAIARRIQAGSCCVNDALVNFAELRAPFSGWKQSGLGGRHGPDGIRKYCKRQTVLVTRFALKRDPLMYPRRPWLTRLIERLMVLAYGRGGRGRPGVGDG